jgi:hypothetical protein
MSYRIRFTAAFFLSSLSLYAQSVNIPLNRDYYHLIERYEIRSGAFMPRIHSVTRPHQRQHVAAFADQMLDTALAWSRVDRFNLEYLSADSWEWSRHRHADSKKPIFGLFYRKKPDLFHVEEKDFDLHVNPVLYLSAGKESGGDATTYINTRGVELRGMIARRLGFYSYAATTQAVFPGYVRDGIARTGAIPGEGFWKKFKDNGVDYFTARGYLSFDIVRNYLNAQLGFDRFSHGTGQRSLLLSDFAPGYTFLRFKTNIWRIEYTNLFAQARADAFYNASGSIQGPFPDKFIASHHLSINITDNLNFGLTETVIAGDSTSGWFDVSYLNPIIFYRALEHQGGSPDNVLIGADLRWNFLRHFSFYGQFMLDEFSLDKTRDYDGWWGNKYGAQMVLKYIDAFGFKNFDLQAEYNTMRPYSYAHASVYTNFAHYRQPLAHALGANFRELILSARLQPLPRLTLAAQVMLASYGEDTVGSNWGKDVMKSYLTREREYGNTIGQGVGVELHYVDLLASYQVRHNMFVDLRLVARETDCEVGIFDDKTYFFSGSFRWNLPRVNHDF